MKHKWTTEDLALLILSAFCGLMAAVLASGCISVPLPTPGPPTPPTTQPASTPEPEPTQPTDPAPGRVCGPQPETGPADCDCWHRPPGSPAWLYAVCPAPGPVCPDLDACDCWRLHIQGAIVSGTYTRTEAWYYTECPEPTPSPTPAPSPEPPEPGEPQEPPTVPSSGGVCGQAPPATPVPVVGGQALLKGPTIKGGGMTFAKSSCPRPAPEDNGQCTAAQLGSGMPADEIALIGRFMCKEIGHVTIDEIGHYVVIWKGMACGPGYTTDPRDPQDERHGCMDAYGRRVKWDGAKWRLVAHEDHGTILNPANESWSYGGICPPEVLRECPAEPAPSPEPGPEEPLPPPVVGDEWVTPPLVGFGTTPELLKRKDSKSNKHLFPPAGLAWRWDGTPMTSKPYCPPGRELCELLPYRKDATFPLQEADFGWDDATKLKVQLPMLKDAFVVKQPGEAWDLADWREDIPGWAGHAPCAAEGTDVAACTRGKHLLGVFAADGSGWGIVYTCDPQRPEKCCTKEARVPNPRGR